MSDNIKFQCIIRFTFLRPLYSFVLASIKSDFVQKVVAAWGSRCIAVLLSFCTFIIITRTLSFEGRGQFGIANTITFLGLQLGSLGFHNSNTFYLSNKRSLLPIMISNSLLISAVVGGVLILLLFCCRHLLLGDTFLPLSLLLLSLLNIPIHICYMLLQALLAGMQKFTSYNLREIFNRLVNMLFILGCALIGVLSGGTIILSQGIALVVCVAMTLRTFSHSMDRLKRPSFSLIKSNFFYGGKAYLVSLFSWSIMRMDIFMLRRFHGIEQVGHLSIALSLLDILLMFPVIISTILLPKLCTESDVKKRWIMTKKISFGSIAILLFIICVIMIGKIPMMWVFGDQFAPCYLILTYLLPGYVFLSIANIVEQFIHSICFPWSAVIIRGIAMIVKYIVSIILIPQMGMQGIGISWTIVSCFVCVAILVNIALFRRYRVSEFISV